MLPQARRYFGWAHATDRHCGLGTQAAHRALALRRNRGSSRRCRNPDRERSGCIEIADGNIAAGGTGNATVLAFGGTTPPRFRWVASRRGYAACMRHTRSRAAHDQRTQSRTWSRRRPGAAGLQLRSHAALDEIATKVALGAHAIILLDQAGWHGAKALVVSRSLNSEAWY
jgi:hypothetical protein